MTNSNQVPTAPGWWYRESENTKRRIVFVPDRMADDLANEMQYYYLIGDVYSRLIEDDGRWLGPVPMPGEWVSREEYDELIRNLDDRI